jgi:hypothetical protein
VVGRRDYQTKEPAAFLRSARARCYYYDLIAVLVYVGVSSVFIVDNVYVWCGRVIVKYQRRDKRVTTFGNGSSSRVTLNLTRTSAYTLHLQRPLHACIHAYIYASIEVHLRYLASHNEHDPARAMMQK